MRLDCDTCQTPLALMNVSVKSDQVVCTGGEENVQKKRTLRLSIQLVADTVDGADEIVLADSIVNLVP